MKYIFHSLIIIFFILKIAYCEETLENTPSSIRYIYLIVPGQGNFGGTENDGKLPQTIPEHYKEIIRLKTPGDATKSPFSKFSSIDDDFGQKNCQDLLHAQLDELFEQSNIKFMVHAYSQGTASILKYVSDLELEDKNLALKEKRTSKIEALILESAMISGFSAMYTYTSNHFHYGLIEAGRLCSQVAYSEYVIPLFAQKTTFPEFDINGTQTIEILKNIPRTFPIIILHSPQDYILPFDGALATYQTLSELENKNVYLIPVDRKIHIDMMSQIIQHREDASKFREIQDAACDTLDKVIDILNKHNVSNISPPKNRNNQPIFDKRHDQKHVKHISNVRSLYSLLTSLSSGPSIKTLASAFSIAIPLTMLCVSRYIHQSK